MWWLAGKAKPSLQTLQADATVFIWHKNQTYTVHLHSCFHRLSLYVNIQIIFGTVHSGYLETQWICGDVVAMQRCCGCVEIRWLCEDMVAMQRCSGYVEKKWLYEDEVVMWRCGGYVEMQQL